MKMQNRLFHNGKEVEDDLDYISENCVICKEELIRIDDIWVGMEDNNYYCTECKGYHNISAIKCKDI